MSPDIGADPVTVRDLSPLVRNLDVLSPGRPAIERALQLAYDRGRIRAMRDVGGLLQGALQDAMGGLL
jgi:hypothetical protein